VKAIVFGYEIGLILLSYLTIIPGLFTHDDVVVTRLAISGLFLGISPLVFVSLGIGGPRYTIDDGKECAPYTQMLLPETASRLVDLDQGAALTLAFVQVCLPLYKKGRSVLSSLNSSLASSDRFRREESSTLRLPRWAERGRTA
jgi:hypothetical protein